MTRGFPLRWLALDADLSGSISLKAWGLPGWARAVWHPWFRGGWDFLLPGKVEVVVVCVFFCFFGAGIVVRYFSDKGRDKPK